MALNGQLKVIWCLLGCVSYSVLSNSGAVRPRGLLFKDYHKDLKIIININWTVIKNDLENIAHDNKRTKLPTKTQPCECVTDVGFG